MRLQDLEMNPQNSIDLLKSFHKSLLLPVDADFLYKFKPLLFFFWQIVGALFGAFRTDSEMDREYGLKEVIEQLGFDVDVGGFEEREVE